MNRDEAIKILNPKTSNEALKKYENYLGFSGNQARLAAKNDACMIAIRDMQFMRNHEDDGR